MFQTDVSSFPFDVGPVLHPLTDRVEEKQHCLYVANHCVDTQKISVMNKNTTLLNSLQYVHGNQAIFWRHSTNIGSMAEATRWGILGTGQICHDFVAALKMMPETEHKIIAVASRSMQRALAFNYTFDSSIPHSFGSYTEMAKAPEIDIIYIGTIHPGHYDAAMLMMENGKHVLCEKPLSMNAGLVRAMTDKARQKKVLLIEGFWSRFFPIYNHLRGELSSATIGDIGTVIVNFGLAIQDKERLADNALGGGALMDIGCYGVMFSTLVYDERPEKICASGTVSDSGVDRCCFITLYYSKNRRAQLNITADQDLDQTATLYGTQGVIKVPNFWTPEKMETPTKTYECPVPKSSSHEMKHLRSEGFIYEISAVRDCLLKGERECSLMTHEHSHIIMEVMDEVRRQMGVVYKEDVDKGLTMLSN